MNKKEVSFHCRCKTETERNKIKEELKISAAINKMTTAEYLVKLLNIVKREPLCNVKIN